MPTNPFASLFRKAAEPPPPELAQALADLDRLGTRKPEFAPSARSLGRLLGLAFRPAGPALRFELDHAARHRAWSEGRPCLRDAAVSVDSQALQDRARSLADCLAAENPAARALAGLLESERDAVGRWAVALLAGCPETVAEASAAGGVDPGLSASILRLSLLPELARWSSSVSGHELESQGWRAGLCPCCGSDPLLVESRGLEQARFARCGLCAADWPTGRMACPRCGEADHRALKTIAIEGEQERFRLLICRSGRHATKVVSTLRALSTPGLLVAELETAPLDFLDLSSQE